MMRPSARKAETKRPSTLTSSSMMRERAALVITTSFQTSTVGSGRRPLRAAPAEYHQSAGPGRPLAAGGHRAGGAGLEAGQYRRALLQARLDPAPVQPGHQLLQGRPRLAH